METTEITDHMILKNLANVETRRPAFEQLLAKYQKEIYFFIRHLGLDHEGADEIIQDVFLNIYRSAGALNLLDSLERIAYGFAAEACQKYFKLKTQEEWLPKMIAHLKQKDFSFNNIANRLEIPVKTVRDAYNTYLSKQTMPLSA